MDNLVFLDDRPRPFEIEFEDGTIIVADDSRDLIVNNIGLHYGYIENTKAGDEIRSFTPKSHVAILNYIKDGLHNMLYYRNGEWVEDTDGMPRFKVSELLK